MAQLDTLRLKRGQQMAALTRMSQYLDSIDPEVVTSKSYFEIRARLTMLSKISEKFEEYQEKIEVLLEQQQEHEEQNFREDFEGLFYSVYAEMEQQHQRLSELTGRSDGGSNASSTPGRRVNLPTIQLPTFDGDYKNWITYRDMFRSLVHDQQHLRNVEKFHYLKASLKGEASSLLDSLQLSEDNYEVAFKMLLDRYDNKKLLIHHHLKLIFETPAIYKESLTDFRRLVDDIKGNVNILSNLGVATTSWDPWLLYLISTKLDNITRRDWEKAISAKESPLLEDFYEFMNERCHCLERMMMEGKSSHKKPVNRMKVKGSDNSASATKSFVSSKVPMDCIHCKGKHSLHNCPKFLELPIKARYQVVKNLKACINCMKNGHIAKVCIAGGCRKCGLKHNTLLHFGTKVVGTKADQPSTSGNSSTTEEEPSGSREEESSVVSASSTNKREVLLSTALVNVVGKKRRIQVARVLLDSGSQSNFITREFFNGLAVSSQATNQAVTGIGKKRCFSSEVVELEIRSKVNKYKFNAKFFVIDHIADRLPQTKINVQALGMPDDVVLADPGFAIPGPIDILLGASTFWDLMCIGQIKLNGKQPIMQKTKLGWIIAGAIPHKQEVKASTDVSSYSLLTLDEQLEKFWSIEDNDSNTLSTHETEFESNFKRTLSRTQDGHFEVGLPIKQNAGPLGDSFGCAHRRLLCMERRFRNSAEFKKAYVEFMTEYERMGHMTLVLNGGKVENDRTYYLPHHGVWNESKITTKLRVVFDGSAKTENGIALNDILLSGSVLQEDLFSILLRFRKHAIVIASDIEKMYRQVFIKQQDRDFQRILWRENEGDPICTYRLNTVTYGTTSGSFLAIRCLHEVANRIEQSHPDISRIIKQDFYVDDLLTGGSTVEEVLGIQACLFEALQNFGFPLRKWNSNHQDVLQEIMKRSSGELKHVIIEDSLTKTLGLHWDARKDSLQYSVCHKSIGRPTKRAILASIAQIFDPLGLIGPVTILFKILMQELWRSKIQWDESIPQDLFTKWQNYHNNWNVINKIIVPRLTICPGAVDIQLHGFCDASQSAYGACIYVISESQSGDRTVRLLCAKSRVAPVKTITLPRLELCAAVLLSKLVDKVDKAIKVQFSKKFLWTDSRIVLTWMANHASTWKTFVANRVSVIHDLTAGYIWKHVPGKDNPADIISRGMKAEELLQSHLWWSGPHWLSLSETEWPVIVQEVETQEIPEKKAVASLAMISTCNEDMFDRYSSFGRVQRVIGYMKRFVHNCKKNSHKKSGVLQAEELKDALHTIIKCVQNEEYCHELRKLERGKSVRNDSKILSLSPIVDEFGLLRVGGRLGQSELVWEEQHPLIIPGHHHVAKLLIKQEHHKQLHAGAQTILNSLRQRFWVTGGMRAVKAVLRKCKTCFRSNPRFYKHQMGELPKERVTPSWAFQNVGIDYAGPLNVKTNKLRNSKITKAYISLFIYFSTRAIHLELVSDLSTDTFLNALKRFVARRGCPKNIYSDNGRNFVGAWNEIRRVERSLAVAEYAAGENINWQFIPPRSPHFGGLWEAAVKSAKTHLKKVVGETILTFEKLNTVLAQIEACLNSRPISPMSEDPNDYSPLTPAHFLLTRPAMLLPQDDPSPSTKLLTRYQHLQYMVRHFWKRWSREYLHQLQQRCKWKKREVVTPKKGDLVLLADEATPPLQWRTGRIRKLHHGPDGVARVADLITSTGTTTRAIRKLCPLPVN